MASINQLITLGLGIPSGIKEFLTFGLQIGAEVVSTVPSARIYIISASPRAYAIPASPRTYTPVAVSRVYVVGAE